MGVERVWIVHSGEYEQRMAIGPAFAREADAELFADDGDDIEEFVVHRETPVKMRHYCCEGWLADATNTVFTPTSVVKGYRIYEESWASWDVLVPELEVSPGPWNTESRHNHVEVHGRNRAAVRKACVAALAELDRESPATATAVATQEEAQG